VLFRFYCDESYDGNPIDPDIFTISGFFSDELTWSEVQGEWSEVNRYYGVASFHATELNCGRGAYSEWPRERRVSYSAELLGVINRQKARMRAYNCGMRAADYRRTINDAGRAKLGHPWIACFKSCIAMIAKDMETLPASDSLSIVVSTGSGFDRQAVKLFKELLANSKFEYRHRLATCIPASPSDQIGLQIADLMAYEYFKRLKDMDAARKMRVPLKLIRENNAYCEGFFGAATFKNMKESIETAVCGPDQLVIIPSL
jgi:hypothetical protein